MSSFFSYDLVAPPQGADHVDGNWDTANRKSSALSVSGRNTRDLSPLREFENLQTLWTSHIGDEQATIIWELDQLQALTFRDVRISRIENIADLSRLTSLGLWGCSALTSLKGINRLMSLERLLIEHIPKVKSLEPLAALENLHTLAIHSAISWDSSGKLLEFESLKPLEKLRNLAYLHLNGIRPLDDDLLPIGTLVNLKEVCINNNFPVEQFARLSAALPNTVGDCLNPYVELEGGVITCKKCQNNQVMLMGKTSKRSRVFICPICDAKALERHVQVFGGYKSGNLTTPES